MLGPALARINYERSLRAGLGLEQGLACLQVMALVFLLGHLGRGPGLDSPEN